MDIKNSTLSRHETKTKYVYHFVGTATTFVYNVRLYKFDIFNANKIVRSVYIRMTKEEFDVACREVATESLKCNVVYSN